MTRLIALLTLALPSLAADEITWRSAATAGDVRGRVHQPKESSAKLPTVVFLTNLSVPRIGTESSDAIVADLVASGHLVLVLDYANHASATSPALNADVLKLREDIAGKVKSVLAECPVDPDRLFILPEGFRLRRDVEFARDGQRVLAMDVAYPSKPAKPVPLLMEITCDNVNRMGSGSLLFCRDTLLEGGAIAGFAVAMVDHPVAPPYKGIDDPMPQCLHGMKAAVQTLRAMSDEIGTSGKIGAIGFSRGGPFAAMLAGAGDVEAAMIHGNRYDYLNLGADDPMLARFEKAWGRRDANEQRWAEHGASYYLTKSAAPMFLNTSDAESPEFRNGLAAFSKKLAEADVEHVYQVDADGRGHRVTSDPKTLAAAYRFFAERLK